MGGLTLIGPSGNAAKLARANSACLCSIKGYLGTYVRNRRKDTHLIMVGGCDLSEGLRAEYVVKGPPTRGYFEFQYYFERGTRGVNSNLFKHSDCPRCM